MVVYVSLCDGIPNFLRGEGLTGLGMDEKCCLINSSTCFTSTSPTTITACKSGLYQVL